MELPGSAAYLAFLAVSVVLIVTPGPSVLLIVSQSLAGGFRRGLVTVAGTSLGMVPPLSVAVLGAGTVATFLSGGLGWLRWLGVAWLAAQGVLELRSAGRAAAPASSTGPAFWQGLMVSLLNPTTTPFFLAFLPQFVDPGAPPLPQLLLLGFSFLVLAAVLDCGWALVAARLGRLFAGPVFLRWRGRVAGLLLLGCAAGLAVARLG